MRQIKKQIYNKIRMIISFLTKKCKIYKIIINKKGYLDLNHSIHIFKRMYKNLTIKIVQMIKVI